MPQAFAAALRVEPVAIRTQILAASSGVYLAGRPTRRRGFTRAFVTRLLGVRDMVNYTSRGCGTVGFPARSARNPEIQLRLRSGSGCIVLARVRVGVPKPSSTMKSG